MSDDPKADFLQALRIPGGEVDYTSDWFGRVVPTIEDLPAVSDADSATIAIAAYCNNCNKVLQLFQGVPLLDYLWRGGERNDALIGLLMTNLDYIGKVGEMTVESPVDSGVYFGFFTDVVVSFTDGEPTAVSCVLDGKDTFTMTKKDTKWVALWAVAIGVHTLVVTATYPARNVEQTVNFEVKNTREMVTIPERGEQYSGGLPGVSASTEDSTGNYSAATLEIINQNMVTLAQGDGIWEAPGIISLPAGAYEAAFSFVVKGTGDIIKKVVNFVIS